ncbi:hypothetical protein RHSIM_Rhsim04G0200500 [Rhododendron simsii]|uniref:Uncharacterized protein n=1 Tax=Rhododendron simsii TaxID=118357 RepID=A0A834H313_RHOSS|nr:hypothetical protein RHSIM_Rhsim04G0200500 [Rhododendron simsii]
MTLQMRRRLESGSRRTTIYRRRRHRDADLHLLLLCNRRLRATSSDLNRRQEDVFGSDLVIMPNNFMEDKIRKVRSGTLRLQSKFEFSSVCPGKVGAGILYDKEGHILTNAHLVCIRGEGTLAQQWYAGKVVANFKGGEQCDAEVLFVDVGNDVALLKIPESVIKPYNVPCDFSEDLPGMGDNFFLVGHPHGLVPFNVKYGRVSDPSRPPSDIPENILNGYFPHSLEHMDPAMKFLELDVMAAHGFSGGPLSTVEGLVFGVFHAGIQGAACYGIPFAIIQSALNQRSPGDPVFRHLKLSTLSHV